MELSLSLMQAYVLLSERSTFYFDKRVNANDLNTDAYDCIK
jgi:hypothetical protein